MRKITVKMIEDYLIYHYPLEENWPVNDQYPFLLWIIVPYPKDEYWPTDGFHVVGIDSNPWEVYRFAATEAFNNRYARKHFSKLIQHQMP